MPRPPSGDKPVNFPALIGENKENAPTKMVKPQAMY